MWGDCTSPSKQRPAMHPHTHRHPFNGPLTGTTRVSRYQKGKTSLDLTEARDSEWQWLQLGHMQVCTSLQTDNHASTPPLCFLQAGCPSCRPTNSVKALKVININKYGTYYYNLYHPAALLCLCLHGTVAAPYVTEQCQNTTFSSQVRSTAF